MALLTWSRLLSEKRTEPAAKPAGDPRPSAPRGRPTDRTAAERDHDRILFATPTRRLGDKTQVFPLERNESVRNRLTHSHEVSNLARSCGMGIVYGPLWERISHDATSGGLHPDTLRRAIPAVLAAIGLAHDIGNPPFGHQGEDAIRTWIRKRDRELFSFDTERNPYGDDAEAIAADFGRLVDRHEEDFRQFEGNAQTLRTVTKLQVVKDSRGLNLTHGTLAALLKYTVGSTEVEEGRNASKAKVGIYASEDELVRVVHETTGLTRGVRHPLTFIMEACDDAAYSIIDAEDAVKKRIVSFADLMAWVRASGEGGEPVVQRLLAEVDDACRGARGTGLPPSELDDVSMQLFRTYAMGVMMDSVLRRFEDGYDEMMEGKFEPSLIDVSAAAPLCKVLKDFDKVHAYRHKEVLAVELEGFNVLNGLMSMLWRGITERKSFLDPASKRTSPFARYAYSRISENYKRVFEGRAGEGTTAGGLPMRYRELQLLTDMVAGMTDQYAVDLYNELEGFHVGASRA